MLKLAFEPEHALEVEETSLDVARSLISRFERLFGQG